MRASAGIAVVAGCFAGAIALQGLRLQASGTDLSVERIAAREAARAARLDLVRQTSNGGLRLLVADWVYLDFLQYFSDSDARQQLGYDLSPEYLETVIANDPNFVQAYFTISTASSLYAGQPQRTVELFEQGLDTLEPAITYSDYVWSTKAGDELLLLGDSDAARQSFARAAEWARLHGSPGAERRAQTHQRLADLLAENPDSRFVRAQSWVTVLGNATTPEVRMRAVGEIRQLGGTVEIDADGNIVDVDLQPLLEQSAAGS